METILAFGLLLMFAALAGIVCTRLRIPPVAGLLVAGMVIGPNVLHLADLPTIQAFAEIGAVLLLFMIGVEFSIAKLLAGGLRPVIASLLLILLSFAIMHESAILLGFDAITSLYIASIFSMSSTAIMMKLLEQKRLVGRQEVPVLVTMLIIEDLLAVFLLTFFSNLRAGYTSGNIFGSILLSLGILALGYVALLAVLRKITPPLLRNHPPDTLVLIAFGLGVGMSVLASFLGLTPAIGAFLAGSIISGLPNGREFEDAVRPFSQLFPSFFFLSIGMLIEPAALANSAGITAILIGMFMLTVFAAVSITFFLITSSGRSAVFAGLAMLPLGEFSLLLAKESVGVAQLNLVGITSVGVLISSLACSFALNHSERIYIFLKAAMPPGVRGAYHSASGYFRSVVGAFEQGGYFHKHLITELRLASADLLFMLALLTVFVLLQPHLQAGISVAGTSVGAATILFSAIAAISLVPLARTILSLKRLVDALAVVFSRTTHQASKAIILRNVAVAGGLFMLFANTSSLVGFLMLPSAFNWLALIFGLLAAFFMWSAIRAASLWFSAHTPCASILRSSVVASKEDVIVVARPRRGRKKKARSVIFLR